MRTYNPLFLNVTADETRVQRILREALEQVHEHGVCVLEPECERQLHEHGVYVWGPEWERQGCPYSSVFGLPMQSHPPNVETLVAARAILDEVARGSGGEEDCFGLDYVQTLETIMVFFDAADLSDAQACAFIENAYANAGLGLVRSRASKPTSLIRLN